MLHDQNGFAPFFVFWVFRVFQAAHSFYYNCIKTVGNAKGARFPAFWGLPDAPWKKNQVNRSELVNDAGAENRRKRLHREAGDRLAADAVDPRDADQAENRAAIEVEGELRARDFEVSAHDRDDFHREAG